VEVFEPGSGTSSHSYDPDYVTGYPGGVFWLTGPGVITKDNINIQLDAGTAALKFQNVAVLDWKTVPNSLSNGTLLGPPTPGTVSVDIEWSNPGEVLSDFSDEAQGFGGDFIENEATIKIATTTAGGFSFAGAGDTSSCFAEIGREQNGVFFDA
jgi:hypothetical protein